MKKVLLMCLAICFALSFSSFTLLNAMKLPKDILMDVSQGKTKNPLYAPVNFPHQKHVKQGCTTCHHKWTNKKEPPKKCTSSGCHSILGAKGAQMKDVHSAYDAYHNRKSQHSCIGCHQMKKKQNLAAGPVTCKKCHKK